MNRPTRQILFILLPLLAAGVATSSRSALAAPGVTPATSPPAVAGDERDDHEHDEHEHDDPEAAKPEATDHRHDDQDHGSHSHVDHSHGDHRHAGEIHDEIEVRGRGFDLVGIASSATEGGTSWLDLSKRPILRPGELLETAPGVIVTQHSGAGKANQYFLRGFNLDHGTDFSVWIAGMPVNMPSHGHGQGWADMNFLIPEVVDHVHYRKGPYFAEKGDFSAAGGIDIEIVRTLPRSLLSLTGGSNDYGRLLWADSFETGGGDLTAAVDVFHDDGPWLRGDDYQGFKALVRYSRGDAERGFSVTAMGYDADWLSTDQIPRRAVESGIVDRLGLVDPTTGGETSRYSLSGEMHRAGATSLTRLGAYLVSNELNLVSNFTYFLEDEEDGDQFTQLDERLIAGVDLSHHRHGTWGGRSVETTFGLGLRADDIDNGLLRSRDRTILGAIRTDRVRQLGGGPFAEAQVTWSDALRTRFGLRADYYYADVESDLAANSGSTDDFLLSPKLAVVYSPWEHTELYFNAGYGFHSNDARGAVIRVDPATGEATDRVEPQVRAKGADVGFRTTPVPGLQTTLSLFVLELDSELVFVGDGGATEASRPSRRSGIEWTNFYQANKWLAFDFDFTWTDSEFTDDDPAGDHIPGAIERTVAAGVAVSDLNGFFGSLRWRYFAGIPLIEDASVVWSSSSLVNGRLGYEFDNGLSVALEVFNLLDRNDSDVEYFYASRLPGEPSGGIEDIHFHPMPERAFRLLTTWRR